MYETDAEIDQLQDLLDRSRARSSGHLRDFVNDERTLTAKQVVALMTGMKVVSLATVTAQGKPRISALDGHFLHGRWTFGTAGHAAKARHLEQRTAVSLAHVDGERLALFSHGHAVRMSPEDPHWDDTLEHWTRHYGLSPLEWGIDDVRLYRLEASWMVGYASHREQLLRDHGIML